MEGKRDRFKDALWFPKNDTFVTIGGAGGIGTWLSLLLTRAGFKPIIYDFDTIEVHNMGGQLFSSSQIGKPKVVAIADTIRQYADEVIYTFNEKITSDTVTSNYTFSAFDNMKARKDLFEAWVKQVDKWREQGSPCLETPVYIDGRLTAEQLQIFCVTPDRIEEYRKHLFDDSEVEDAPCTLKQTSHSAAMIGAHMTAFFTNHITNNNQGDDSRDLPFLYEYFIPLNLTTNSDE